MYQLNKTLKLLRLSTQVNQVTLAQKLDVSRSYLSELEAGKKKPSLETLAKYSIAFDLPVWKIIWLSEKQIDFTFAELYQLLTAPLTYPLVNYPLVIKSPTSNPLF